MRSDRINLTKDQIIRFCQKNHIKKMALYGSALRDDFGPDSDIDVLVNFDMSYPIGLMTVSKIELELSDIIGRKVDLRTPEDLSRYFRDKVVAEAEVLYE
jgi:predicted nucleotidyltransferase